MICTTFESPIGEIYLKGTKEGIALLSFKQQGSTGPAPPFIKKWIQQLEEYFLGKRKTFSIPLLLEGRVFRQSVWTQVQKIPYGQTRSYGEIACAISNPRAYRAVGGALNANPIALLVPCHRVIGTRGGLTGYEGGLDRKKWLLDHEGKT